MSDVLRRKFNFDENIKSNVLSLNNDIPSEISDYFKSPISLNQTCIELFTDKEIKENGLIKVYQPCFKDSKTKISYYLHTFKIMEVSYQACTNRMLDKSIIIQTIKNMVIKYVYNINICLDPIYKTNNLYDDEKYYEIFCRGCKEFK